MHSTTMPPADDRPPRRALREAVLLWVAAMIGVAVLSATVIPQLLATTPRAVPVGVALAASMLQSGVLLAAACWAGVALSHPLGLRAPVVEAIAARTPVWPALRPQLAPGAAVGVATGVMLVALLAMAPAASEAARQVFLIPLVAKLLYGGVTEEVLMRWGMMTTIAWILVRLTRGRGAGARPAHIVSAAVAAALVFGVAHLPAAVAMGITLYSSVVAFVVLGNAVPGLLFGLLYWRRGLEAAILAHAVAHAVAVALTAMIPPG